jgi:hypothetical protein
VANVLITGVVLYAIVTPIASRIPTISALVASGSALSIVALVLKCWNASWQNHRRVLALWLAIASLLPLVTVVTQGFLGFGFVAMLTIFAFVASLNRPRTRHVAAAALLAYFGLSIYITYMRDRRDIRDVVWTGAALANRVDQIQRTLAGAEWFDPRVDAHLERIERRLNQNFLIGASVVYLESGAVPYARGETIIDAVLSLVPRAFWPDKPIQAGSGQLVTTYTGIHFVEGTSVGIGQVMEFYVNFGTQATAASVRLHPGARRSPRVPRAQPWRRQTLHDASPGLSLLQTAGRRRGDADRGGWYGGCVRDQPGHEALAVPEAILR